MDYRPATASLAWFVLLALVLHAGLMQLHVLDWSGPGSIGDKRQARKQEREYLIERPEDLDRPIVQTSKAKPDPEAEKEKARFAGEFRNRARKETQSTRRGRFQERTILRRGGAGGRDAETGTELPADERGETNPADGLQMHDLLAESASPSRDRDVAEGDETVLNTDTVVYASFVNRIADAIYDPWVTKVREVFQNTGIEGRRIAPATYVTRLDILMDAAGNVTAIKVLESSGIPELDEAPKRAFWEREPFPNPPSQMFSRDGMIRFVYEFKVDNKTSFFNILPWST